MFHDALSKRYDSQSILSSPYLCWKDRPQEINQAISKAFQDIMHCTQSEWGRYNGEDEYNICGIKEHKLMRKIIRDAPAEIKDFYALDIGAGNFQWGRELARYLKTKEDIPKDVKIHIIGVRGESNLDKKVKTIGQCKLYELGTFQVENLTDEFEKLGLELVNKVDLVVSRWCFRHLVDPVGTFTQAYDLLRPKTGYFLFDAFLFFHEHDKWKDESINFRERMIRLCLETNAPFLTNRDEEGHFVVNKPDDHPCHLYKQYLEIEDLEIENVYLDGSKKITRFKEHKETDAKITRLLWKGDYRGDKGLYELLRQNGLLLKSHKVWGPIQDKDNSKKTPSLHAAIASGDEEAIERCLKGGCDINESDHTGATPLHLAIKHNNYKLFSMLLEKGALTKLFAEGEFTPLHYAAQYDRNGYFIRDLMSTGININIKPIGLDTDELSPIDCAIEHKNLKATELLLEANAIVNYKNRCLLYNDPIFSPIQHLFPKKTSELKGFDVMIDHIKKGNCVLLTYTEAFWGYIFNKSASKEAGRLIRVTVNPETRLLDDENYEEIEEISGCNHKRVWIEDLKNIPQIELQLIW